MRQVLTNFYNTVSNHKTFSSLDGEKNYRLLNQLLFSFFGSLYLLRFRCFSFLRLRRLRSFRLR